MKETKDYELVVEATIENTDKVIAVFNEWLAGRFCPDRVRIQLDVAVEEIYVNIAHYAYGDTEGKATIKMESLVEPEAVRLTFIDEGTPYNPLAREDPDTTLSAEERKIGGLGVYMVKKSMDEVSYEYRENKNIFMIYKKLQ